MEETEGLSKLFVSLVSTTGTGDLNFLQENICSVFNNAAIREMPVGVVSVIGEEVYTKSSMIINMARFAMQENGGTVDLQFPIPTVPETDSKIVTLSKPVLVKFGMYRELGLFLIGTRSPMTRGVCNSQLSGILATVSSHMIFLTSSSIQVEELSWLRELERRKIKLDQLTILVQNWDQPKIFLFGGTGGQKFLNQFFQAQPGIYDLLGRVVRSVNCFLMPREDDSMFNNSLTQFLSRTVGRLYLLPKEIDGRVLLCGGIPELIESYGTIAETGTFETQTEEVMDTSEENGDDPVERMEIDSPQICLEEFDKNNGSGRSNFENPDRLSSTKLSLEEYLKRREIIDKPKSVNAVPVSSDSLDEILENQSTPEDILKKYAKPSLNSHFDLPKNFNVILPPSSEEIMMVDPVGTGYDGLSDINTTSVNFMEDFDTTTGVEIASSGTNVFDIQKISDTFNYFNYPEVNTDENERMILQKNLFQNAIENFKRIPILHSHAKAEENWSRESFETTSEGVYGQIETSDLRKKFSHYFSLWRIYDRGVGELYSFPAKTPVKFVEFHEQFKKKWVSVKTEEFDRQLEEITLEKIDETFELILKELGTESESTEYAIMIAKKYYQYEMQDPTKDHERVKEKLVNAFTQANKLQNDAWNQFYSNFLECELDKLKSKPLNFHTPTPVPSPTKYLEPEPKTGRTTQKFTDSEMRASFSKAISNCLQHYQSEIDRDVKFGRVRELTQLVDVHNVAKDQSIRKFKKETGSLNGQLFETSYTELLEIIEEEYSSYKKVTEMKLENEKSERNQKSITQRGTAAAAAINCTKPTIPFCDNFIGIHACNSYIRGAVRLREGLRILPNFGQTEVNIMFPEGLRTIVGKFKSYFENELNGNLDHCVIAVPMSLTQEEKSQLTIELLNEGIKIVEIISETCAVALGFFKKDNSKQNLIVLLCDSDENWSAGFYNYEKHNGTVRLLEPFLEGTTTAKINTSKDGRSKTSDIIKYLVKKVNLKKFDILLVGNQSVISSAKLEIARNGFSLVNHPVHLGHTDVVVEGSILYASAIFRASGIGMRICAGNLDLLSSGKIKENRSRCSLL